jgi:hypothetical protein
VKGIPRGKIRPSDGCLSSSRVKLDQVGYTNSASVLCRRSRVRGGRGRPGSPGGALSASTSSASAAPVGERGYWRGLERGWSPRSVAIRQPSGRTCAAPLAARGIPLPLLFSSPASAADCGPSRSASAIPELGRGRRPSLPSFGWDVSGRAPGLAYCRSGELGVASAAQELWSFIGVSGRSRLWLLWSSVVPGI